MAIDDVDKSTVLNTFFAKQSPIDDSSHDIPIDNADFNGIPSSYITIKQHEVHDILKTLKQVKGSVPYGINNIVLTETDFQLAPFLCTLFNQSSLMSCTVPMTWKISNVCPIFKSGESLPPYYRPISLLSGIEKVFELIKFMHVFNRLKRD